MKAAVFDEFGPPEVLHVAEVDLPGALASHDLLVRVHATSVNFGDTIVRNFAAVTPRAFHMPWLFWAIGRLTFGWRRPRRHILGSDFAGTVAAVGDGVRRFRAGDAVFGYLGARLGAYAEYLTIRDDAIVAPKPAGMRFEDAAACPYGALMAYGILRSLRPRPGERVLVVGASGGIGVYLVQLLRHAGARVTGVCGPARAAFVTALGAEAVIDYTTTDVTAQDAVYDTIVDILGTTRFAQASRVLAPHGRLVYLSFKLPELWQMVRTAFGRGQRVRCLVVNERPEHLLAIKALIDAGAVRGVVDRTFPLQDAAAAHRRAESGAGDGAVVITIGDVPAAE